MITEKIEPWAGDFEPRKFVSKISVHLKSHKKGAHIFFKFASATKKTSKFLCSANFSWHSRILINVTLISS